jgi:hypothetical protein
MSPRLELRGTGRASRVSRVIATVTPAQLILGFTSAAAREPPRLTGH